MNATKQLDHHVRLDVIDGRQRTRRPIERGLANRAGCEQSINPLATEDGMPGYAIQSIEIEGPFFDDPATFKRARTAGSKSPMALATR
jgi:hypothetical protein